jgi:hypothetical protein
MKLLFYSVVFSLTGLIQAQHCRIAGQIFFADVVDHTITLKTDSGDLVNFSYDGATSFLLAGSGSQPDVDATRVLPEQLNNGDRLCVGTSEPPVITVTRRRDIDARQKKEVAAWQADSLYGVVSGLDRNARRITLDVSAGDRNINYSVDVSPGAAYWLFPRNTIGLSDAVTGSLDQVAPGDTLYVRGTKDSASQKFVANLIVSGGFRSFAATIETIKPLDELLDVHLVLSGNRRAVHISPGELFAIGQAGAAGKVRQLYRIAAADLHPGDTVLILGVNEGPDSLSACALIAGFSPFRVVPPDSSQLMRWIFDNLSPVDPYFTLRSPAPH